MTVIASFPAPAAKLAKLISSIIPRRTRIDALARMRITVTGGVVRLAVADCDAFALWESPAAWGACDVAVGALSFAAACADADTVAVQDGAVSLGGVTLPAFDGEDCPELPSFGAAAMADFDAQGWTHLVKGVLPFVSDEETRYYPKGVFLANEEKGKAGLSPVACATNGRYLAAFDGPCTLPAAWKPVIVPSETIKLFDGAANLTGADVSIAQCGQGRWLRFSAEGLTVGGRAIGGSFPDFRRAIPTEAGFARFSTSAKALSDTLATLKKSAPKAGMVTFSSLDTDAPALSAAVGGMQATKCFAARRDPAVSVSPLYQMAVKPKYMAALAKAAVDCGGKSADLSVSYGVDAKRGHVEDHIVMRSESAAGMMWVLMPMRA